MVPPRFVVDASGCCTEASAAAGAVPALAPPHRRGDRRVVSGVFRVTGWAGTLLVLFAAYSLFGTGLLTDRSQDDLRGRFEGELAARAEAAPSAGGGGGGTVPTLDLTPPRPPVGDAVAILKIPRLGLEQAVVEGTRFGDLTKGPGHYVDTPLPGDVGNAGIAGHRTTYGAPFFRLDELRAGDAILVTTLAGMHRFEVTETWVVKPAERWVLAPTDEPALTLTTCHPAFRRTQRLVVRAVLRPEGTTPEGLDELVAPRSIPAPLPAPPLELAAANAAAPDGATDAAPPWRLAVAGAAAAGVWAALQLVARRRPRLAWVALGGPLVAALGFLFDAVNRTLGTAI